MWELALGVLLVASPLAAEPDGTPLTISLSHHHVLRRWLAAADAGVLPRSGLRVLHVDAHPDLAVPARAVARQWPTDPMRVVGATDIDSFQLAAVWLGLVEEVVWLRPDWATQIPDGSYTVHLGRVGAALRVALPVDYYLLDSSWAPHAALAEPRTFRLRVMPLREVARTGLAFDGRVVLDVDLDAFGTFNPAAQSLRAGGIPPEDLVRLREIFDPASLALPSEPEARVAAVEDLRERVASLAAGEDLLGGIATLWRAGLGPGDLWDLFQILRRPDAEVAGSLVEQGPALVGLPEHRPRPEEIERTARWIATLAAHVRPSLITIARSTDDGFTPPDLWPEIEWRLLVALHEAGIPLRISLDPGLAPAPQPAWVAEALGH